MWPLAFCLCLGPVLVSIPAPAEDLDQFLDQQRPLGVIVAAPFGSLAEDLDQFLDRQRLQSLEASRQALELSKKLVFLLPLEGPADVLRRARTFLEIWKEERAVKAMRKATEDRIRWRQTLHGPPRPPDPEVEKFVDELLQKFLKNREKD